MVLETLPEKFLLFNDLQTKNISVAVKIDGLDLLSNRPLYTYIRYGDPGIFYGMPGIVYGGMRPVAGVRDYLSLEGSSLSINQRLEPEQGRASVSMISLSFVDKDGYMTRAISPGVIIDEILNREVLIQVGYMECSYPEEYFTVFRGRVSSVESRTGMVVLQLSDPNLVRRQNVFFIAKTKLSGSIDGSVTTIPVINNADFPQQILGPGGGYDSAIKTYLWCEDEIIEYPATGFGSNQFTSCTRGARGTSAVPHGAGAEVSAAIQVEDHGIDMALKMMLSGWAGPYMSGIAIESIVRTGDPSLGDIAGAIILPEKIDADGDYGIRPGSYITISGSGIPANNTTVVVNDLLEMNLQPNRIIVTSGSLSVETSSPATLALRSQYDTYPEVCSVGMTPKEVDIEQHVNLKRTFLGSSQNSFRFFLTDQQPLKSFLEAQVYLPMAAYSLTRQGRLSAGYTKPPIADQRLQVLTEDNVIDPVNIRPQRGVNNRKFFNEIHWDYDKNDAGDFTSLSRDLDTNSQSNTIKISSVLPIKADGGRTDLGFDQIITRRNRFLLNRYKDAAILMDARVNFGLGIQIEAGDVVAVKDGGTLHIANFNTGERDIGTQLYEVIDRTISFGEGNVQLKLLSGLGANVDDRYATVSPSSKVSTGSTTTSIRIKDSYGALYPGNEKKKWTDYIGLNILVHDATWTQEAVVTLTGFDPGDSYKMLVSPALPWVPAADFIVDLDRYSTSTDEMDQQIAKLVHAFVSPSVSVVSGISQTQFTVGAGDASKFFIGSSVYIHNSNYSLLSVETKVSDVTGVTITVEDSLGFIPASGQKAELIGFADHGGSYRYV